MEFGDSVSKYSYDIRKNKNNKLKGTPKQNFAPNYSGPRLAYIPRYSCLCSPLFLSLLKFPAMLLSLKTR